MVCLGNICRSPTAHGVLEKLIQNKGLYKNIEVDSAGTSHYHIGQPPDPRSIAAAELRGYQLHTQIARQLRQSDFQDFDYILAMDRSNLKELQQASPQGCRASIQLLLDYSPDSQDSVPDPYYSGEHGFELVLDLVEAACLKFLAHLEHRLQAAQAEA